MESENMTHLQRGLSRLLSRRVSAPSAADKRLASSSQQDKPTRRHSTRASQSIYLSFPILGEFKHKPLDYLEREIRLLHVSPSALFGGRFSLKHFQIQNQPRYYAVSYTWGPEHPNHHIFINRSRFTVRENLYRFLQNFNERTTDASEGSIYLWIDQICIDQTNTAERNNQVYRMDDIFRSAYASFVWLGQGDPASERAIEILREKSTRMEDRNIVQDFLDSNAYWKRIWIVQEVLLSHKLILLCGAEMLDFTELQSYWTSYLRGSIATAADGLMGLKDTGIVKLARPCFDLLSLVDRFSTNCCHDPRDKVFALQGLLVEDDRCEIDYDKGTEKVWIDVAKSHFWRKKVSILSAAPQIWQGQLPRHDFDILITLGEQMVFGSVRGTSKEIEIEQRLTQEWRQAYTVAVTEAFAQETWNLLEGTFETRHLRHSPWATIPADVLRTLMVLPNDDQISPSIREQASFLRTEATTMRDWLSDTRKSAILNRDMTCFVATHHVMMTAFTESILTLLQSPDEQEQRLVESIGTVLDYLETVRDYLRIV